MLRTSIVALLGIAVSLGITGLARAAAPAASPLVQAQLRGHWICVQTGTQPGTFHEDWTPVFGGTWLRATDSVKGVATAEHTVTYSKATSTWIDLDASPAGMYDVMHGTGSGAGKIAFHAVYPNIGLAVTYNRLGPAKYTIDVNGKVQGRAIKSRSVCTK